MLKEVDFLLSSYTVKLQSPIKYGDFSINTRTFSVEFVFSCRFPASAPKYAQQFQLMQCRRAAELRKSTDIVDFNPRPKT